MSIQATKQNKYTEFTSKIFGLPFWIKEVLYIEIKEKLEEILKELTQEMVTRDNSLQLFKPKMTYNGDQELAERKLKMDVPVYKFLEGVREGQTIIEITLNNCWTLAETTNCLILAINNDLVRDFDKDILRASAFYISGKIRLGEYLARIGKITLEQLDEALRTQKNIAQSTGEKPGIATILINLNVISEQDVQNVLLIKDDSERRFFIDFDLSQNKLQYPNSAERNLEIDSLNLTIDSLTEENQLLKDQLRKILELEN